MSMLMAMAMEWGTPNWMSQQVMVMSFSRSNSGNSFPFLCVIAAISLVQRSLSIYSRLSRMVQHKMQLKGFPGRISLWGSWMLEISLWTTMTHSSSASSNDCSRCSAPERWNWSRTAMATWYHTAALVSLEVHGLWTLQCFHYIYHWVKAGCGYNVQVEPIHDWSASLLDFIDLQAHTSETSLPGSNKK